MCEILFCSLINKILLYNSHNQGLDLSVATKIQKKVLKVSKQSLKKNKIKLFLLYHRF